MKRESVRKQLRQKNSVISGRGARCEICLEVVSSTTKAFPCSDGELCGFNCGNLCNGLKPPFDATASTVSSVVDFTPEPKPCVRGDQVKRGQKNFYLIPMFDHLSNIYLLAK